jgi:hypothetical protein
MHHLVITLYFILQAITEMTSEALASKCWLDVCMKTVQEFLKVDNLNIDEVDLVRALIRWGENQVKNDPKQAENLRDKILPALPLIRFVGMSQKDVAKVCMEELAAVLTAEEKLQIMQSSLLKDKELLPLNFTKSGARNKRIQVPAIINTFVFPPAVPLRKLHVADFPFVECEGNGDYRIKPFSFRLEFKVVEPAKLVGLNLGAGISERTSKFFFTVFNSGTGNLLASGNSDLLLNHSTGRCFKVSPEIKVPPSWPISIQFTFPLISNRSGLPRSNRYFAPRELTSANGWPKVTLTDGLDALFPLWSLVFDVLPKEKTVTSSFFPFLI